MFSVIYALLFAVWLFVLNSKIHHGPEEVDAADRDLDEALIDTVGRRCATAASDSGASLTAPGENSKGVATMDP